jgi:hypothetical protein
MKVKQIGLYYDLSLYWIEKRGLTLWGPIKNLFKKRNTNLKCNKKLKPRKDPLKKQFLKANSAFLCDQKPG